MDPAGARALAQRLAEGKEPAEMTPEEVLAAESRRPDTGESDEPLEAPPPAAKERDVIYVHPAPRTSYENVWIYVRDSDGRLRRAR
jgi:hypothetical protein